MKQELTQRSRSQSRTECTKVPQRFSVVSTLAFLAFVLLGMCGAQTARAQTFKIEPLDPQPFAFQQSRGEESRNAVFRVTLTGGTGGKTYSVNLAINGIANARGDIPQEGVDYDSLSNPGLFPRTIPLQPGQTRDVTLLIYDDESYEQQFRSSPNFDEQVVLTLSGAAGPDANPNIDPARDQVTYGIIDNDALPILRVRDTRVAVQDNTAEARFVEGSTGTTTGQNFTVELAGASRQPGFRNNQQNLVLTTSILPVSFDYSFGSGNGTDPTTSGQRAPGSATLGTDFMANPNMAQTADIAPGISNVLIPFFVVGDTQDENNEAFIVNILNPRNTDNPTGPPVVSNPGGDTGFGVILDDDAPVVTVSDASVTEGNAGRTQLRFSLQLSAPSVQPVQLVYSTRTGTAVSFVRPPNNVADYTGVFNGTVTFAAGETLQFVNIDVNGDLVIEGAATGGVETFSVVFEQLNDQFGSQFYDDVPNRRAIPGFPGRVLVPERVQRGVTFPNNDNSALGTIIDDDVANISIADAQVVEGDGTGQTTLNFRISIPVEQRSENAITVTATTSSGPLTPAVPNTDPATPGTDYVSKSIPVTIPATQTEAVFQVAVNNDDVDERNETLLVTLTNNSPGTRIEQDRGIGLIIDNDGPVISIGDVQQPEGAAGVATVFNFPVTLSAPSVQDVSVSYRTIDGTAVSSGLNPDFTGVMAQPVQTVTIPAGQTTGTIPITIIGDDIREAAETFRVILSGAQNAAPTPFAVSEATGTILNDDAVPTVTVADVSTVEGNDAPFIITLSNRSDQPIVVNFSTGSSGAPNSATPGADFGTITNGTVTFNPPSASAAGDPITKTIFVPTVNDTIDEANEQFNFNLTSATNATIVRAQAIGTIVDNDVTVTFGGPNGGAVSATEGDVGGTKTLDFTVQLSKASATPITLNFTTTGGTGTGDATTGTDFTATTGTLTFAPGTVTRTISVPIIGDTLDELNETLTLTLSTLNGAAFGGMPAPATIAATGTIIDDDGAPSLSIGNVTVLEGDGGTTNANFTVMLSPASGQDVTVDFATSDNTATAGADYTTTAGTLNFAAGETTKNIIVPVIGDVADEVNETFSVNLSNPTNAILGAQSTGTGTIIDDDGPTVTAADVTVSEGAGTVTIPVTLSAGSPQEVKVAYSTADITAVAGSDYTAKTDVLTFAPNTMTQNIVIQILNDNFNEATETFAINFSGASNATVANAQTIVTITDDDAVPTISINDVSVTEGNSGTVNAVFTVNLNSPSLQTVTVAYATANGTATANSDFQSTAGTLTFAPNQTSQTITVPVIGDTLNEGNETFAVNLSTPGAATLAKATGIGTIIDDDVANLALTITPATVNEGALAQGTVTRNTQVQGALTVTLTSSNPSLLTVPATVTIPAGAASASFQVQAVDDQVANADANVTVTAAATGFSPANATVAVTDNDTPRLTLTVANTQLAEGGPATTATVSRNTATNADLTVTLGSSAPTSISVPAAVTIPAGQQSVTFAVTPVDNQISDGTRSVSIGAARAGLLPASVTLTVTDNDNAAVVVAPLELRTSEAGGSATFTVRLISQPTSNVVVNVVSSDPTEGTVSPAALTFTAQNFAQEQTVTVTGVDDQITDGSITYQVNTTISSSDATYAAIDPADVQVTNTDDDLAGFIVTPRGVRTTENGGSGTFSIRLTSQPTANVTIGLSVDQPTKASLSAASLTFTPQNFATPQNVVVTGRDDAVRAGTVIFNIITAPAVSADRAYNGLNPPDVKAASTDNDISGVVVSAKEGTKVRVTEGERTTFNIRLRSQPTSPVRITLSSSDTSEARLPQPSIIIDSRNYLKGVDVPVDGVNDGVADGPQRFIIRTERAESADRVYNLPGGNLFDIGGITDDANEARLVLAGPTSSTTSEAGTSTRFSVRLSSRPVSPVRVRITSSDTSEGVVEGLSPSAPFLFFSAQNFSTPQIVTVTGRDDNIEDGPQRYNINLRAESMTGPFSASGNVSATVALVNLDNDDNTKPVISLNGVPGRVLRPGDVRTITGQATDANGIARISVVIQKTDGTTPTFLNANGSFGATRVALPASFNATTGQFSVAIPGGTLPVGTYVVEAAATDRAGNVSAPDRISFAISNQLLAITIATPVDGSFVTGTTSITGSVSSQTGSAINAVTATLQSGNGAPRSVPLTLTGNRFSSASLGALPSGTYLVTVTASDAAGNRQSATSTFRVDTLAPTSVTITSPTNDAVLDNITTISGTASDNAGGSGIARVEVAILRNTDGRYFNGRTFVDGFATAPATVQGNTFVLNISGGLPADPDPLNATYTLQAFAFDGADNTVRSDVVRVFLSSNGSAPGTPGTPNAPGTQQASQAQLSPVKYSAGTANASDVILNFTGALNASAAKIDNYKVTVNGVAVAVDNAAYRGSACKVSLADSLASGDKVEVTYNLQDAQGRTLKGKVALAAR